MPALQVRDLPQDIYEQLVQSARREHRSLAQETTHILERHFRVSAEEGASSAETVGGLAHAASGREMGYGAVRAQALAPETPSERKRRKCRLFASAHAMMAPGEAGTLTPPEELLAAQHETRGAQLLQSIGSEALGVGAGL